jgi:hypothetical protein
MNYEQITQSNFPATKKTGNGRFPLFSAFWNALVTGQNKIAVDTIEEKTNANGISIDGVSLKDGQVKPRHSAYSQGTNITTAVATTTPAGVITTQSATAAAGAAHTFNVTNSLVVATSNVRAYVVNYSGTITTNGLPNVIVDNRGTGSFDIIVFNGHGSNALSGTLAIGYEIIN